MGSLTAELPIMAKKKAADSADSADPGKPGRVGRPRTSDRNDRVARVDSTVLGWAEMVAKAKGITVAEYISETLREPVWRDFGELMRSMSPPGSESGGNA